MIYTFIEQNVRPGPHISLKCSAMGSPPPQVKLLFIKSRNKHLFNTGKISISKLYFTYDGLSMYLFL